jgi:hypothetical protein
MWLSGFGFLVLTPTDNQGYAPSRYPANEYEQTYKQAPFPLKFPALFRLLHPFHTSKKV